MGLFVIKMLANFVLSSTCSKGKAPFFTSTPMYFKSFDRFLQQNNDWYTGGVFSTSNLRKLSVFLPTEMLATHILKCYPYYASTVSNQTHGLQKQNRTCNFFLVWTFSVFSWRKPDVFRLWERKFSWYLFPQQCLAAFGTQVPIVKLPILQVLQSRGCRSHAIWLARKNKVRWLWRGYSRCWK